MASLILDRRDQIFVLQEMLKTEDLCGMSKWADFSQETFEMVLKEAERLAVDVIFPTLVPGDREGCKLEDGQVHVPPSFQRCFDLYRDGGWINMGVSQEAGGQGFPYSITVAAKEWFIHNFSFFVYPEPAQAAAHLIEVFGTDAQKKKYMEKMYAGNLGRHHGADGALRGVRRGQPEMQGHPKARRHVPSPGNEAVHHRGRS
jgi:alkylation response protein AidB-like acyl-CoA dehydrogenase